MTEGPEGGQKPQEGTPPPETQWQPSNQPAADGGSLWQQPNPAGGSGPQWQQPPPPAGAGWSPPPAHGLPGGPPGPNGPSYPGGPGGPGYPGGPGGFGPPGGPPVGAPVGAPPWAGAQPQPYGFGAPQAPKKNGATVGIVVGALVVILLIVVVVVSVTGSGGDDPAKTSGKTAAEAGQALGKAAGLSYTGTYGGGPATFSVTKAGTARGTYSAHSTQVSRVDIGGSTYLKAGSGFWTAEGEASTSAKKADNTWAKAPPSAIDLKLADLSPSALATILGGAGDDPSARRTSLSGTPVIKMTVRETTYYIATSGHRLMRIEGTAGADPYALNVTTLEASGMGPVFTRLRTDVQALAGAYDPAITMIPVGKIEFGGCTEAGCTVHGKVMPSAPGASTGTIRVTMNARFWGSGATVSTCSGSASAKPSHRTTVTCRTSGKAWKSWYGAHRGRFTIHASSTFAATVNSSSDVNALMGKLSQEQQGG